MALTTRRRPGVVARLQHADEADELASVAREAAGGLPHQHPVGSPS
jgi:hypothetical protein